MTTQAIEKPSPISTIRDLLQKSMPQIKMSVPKHLTPDRLVRIAMTTIQRNPKLLDCDPKSLLGTIIQCGQLGLEPDDILGRAYLVPFRNNKANRTDVQLIIGYKGLIDLARRSAKVSNIYVRMVYEKEPFNLEYGTNAKITHRPLSPAKRGVAIVGVYAVAHFTDGGMAFEWLWKAEVDKIREKSKAKDTGPWVTDYEQMVLKTAIRRLAKYLPMSVEFQKAAALDELTDTGKSQKEIFFGDEEVLETEVEDVAGKTEEKAEALKQKLQEVKTPKPPEDIPGGEKLGAIEEKNPPSEASSLSLRTGTGQTPRTRSLIADQIFPLLESLGVCEKEKAEELLENRIPGIMTFEVLDFERAKAFLDFLGEWKLGGCNVRYEDQGWIVEYPPE